MSLLTNVLMAATVGLMSFFLLPIIVSAASPRAGLRVSRFYDTIAMGMLGTGGFVLRETGGIQLARLRYDAELQRFRASLGRVTKYFADPAGCMGRWAGARFGLADEKRGVIFDPVHADVAGRFKEVKRNDEWVVSDGGTEYRRKYFGFEPVPTAVDLQAIRTVVQGSSNPMRLDDHYRIWEAALSSPTAAWVRENIDRISAVGTGFVIMWIIREVGGSASLGGGGLTETVGGFAMWLSVGVPI